MRLVDRPVGEALIDQRVIAGVGNIVKSEALWECRIDPFAAVSALDDGRLLELAEVGRPHAREGVDSGGALPRARLPPRRPPLPALRHGPITSAPQGEQRRTSYWCPACCR